MCVPPHFTAFLLGGFRVREIFMRIHIIILWQFQRTKWLKKKKSLLWNGSISAFLLPEELDTIWLSLEDTLNHLFSCGKKVLPEGWFFPFHVLGAQTLLLTGRELASFGVTAPSHFSSALYTQNGGVWSPFTRDWVAESVSGKKSNTLSEPRIHQIFSLWRYRGPFTLATKRLQLDMCLWDGS